MNFPPAIRASLPPAAFRRCGRWLAVCWLLLSAGTGYAQSRTPWQMLDRTTVYPFAATRLGDTNAYALAPVPVYNDPGWGPAPNTNSIGFNRPSVAGVGNCNGSHQSDACNFTYFQCLVYLPPTYRLTAFTISLTNVDDGVRISLYNSSYPGGGVVPSSYYFDTGVIGSPGWGTTDLAPLFKVGETNRVVITLQDDCAGISAVSNTAFVFNGAPALYALCTNVTVTLDRAVPGCTTNVSVDNGSYTPVVGDTITLNQIPPPPYSAGTNAVTLWVTDNHGASNSCTATVKVIDATPPVITCPANLVLASDPGKCTRSNVTFAVTATDNCPGPVAVTSVPPSGSTFPVGTTIVTSTATDSHGNTGICTFPVTVSYSATGILKTGQVVLMGIDAEDGTVATSGHGPILTWQLLASNILRQATGGTGILAIGSGKSATDDVTRFWNALGAYNGQPVTHVNGNNIATASFAGYRMIGITSDLTDTPSGGLTPAENNALATRAADIAAFINNGGALLGFASVFAPSATAAGPYPYMSGVGGVTLFNQSYSAIDPTTAGLALGITDVLDLCCWHQTFVTYPSFLKILAYNTGTTNPAALGGSVSVPVFTLTCPNAVTSLCPSSLTLTGQVYNTTCRPLTVTWKVDGATVQTNLLTPLSPSGTVTLTYAFTTSGNHTVTLTANDGLSTQTCATAINFTGRPTITCPPNLVLTADPGKCSRSNVTFVVGASNVCSLAAPAQVVSTPPSGSTFPVGTTPVTNVVSDRIYGTNACTFTVTVIDAEPPALVCPPDIMMDANAGCFATNVNLGPPVAGDNCGVASVVNTGAAGFHLNPIGWWPGDGNALDVIGGNHGTLNGGMGYTTGEVAQAFSFDGVDDFVSIPGTCRFNSTNDATLEFWLNAPNTVQQAVIWTRADTADLNRFHFYVFGNATFGFDYRSPGGTVHTLVSGVPIPQNTWTHLAITRTGGNFYSLYRDGVLAATATDAAPDLPNAIGWRFAGRGSFMFQGKLDEVAVFDHALAPAEINAIYQAGAAGKCGTPAPPAICALPKFTNALVGPLHNPANDHYYYLLDSNSWTGSEASAVALGGHLATINDAAENGWVYTNFSTFGGTNRALWIGLNDAALEGNYVWASGEPLTYTNWPGGQPDNCGDEDYVHIFEPADPLGRAGHWNDLDNLGRYCNSGPVIYTQYGVVEVASAPVASFNLGTNFVTWTATDIHGNSNSCVQRVIVRDPLTPSIHCPADLTLPTDPGQCSRSNVTFAVNFSGNCAGATLAQPEGLTSGATFPKGVTTNRFVATDGSGNAVACFFTVTITDNEPPAITCPPDLTLNANTASGATNPVLGAASATDNCAVAGIGNDAPPLLPFGTNFVTWIATDTSGNTSACPQRVTVIGRICAGDLSATAITNVTLCASNPAVFITVATSHDLIGYLWKFNGQTIPGKTNNSLVVPNVGVPNAGTYTVEVRTDCGTPMLSRSATLTVMPLPETNPVSYTNADGVIINTFSVATPYGSPITPRCVPGVVKRVTVWLHDFTHRFPNDANVVLMSPDGRAVKLIGGAGAGISVVTGVDLLFTDATSTVPETTNALVSGSYHPSDFSPSVTLPGPAPAKPYSTNLDTFIGADPNGVWKLFVYDSTPGDGGNIVSWSLNLEYQDRDDGLHLENPRMFSNGMFQAEVLVQPGLTSVMQFSTNLVQWIPVATNVYSNYPGIFTDVPPQFQYRFYRAKLMP